MPEETTSPPLSNPSETSAVEWARRPTTILTMASDVATATLSSARRRPIRSDPTTPNGIRFEDNPDSTGAFRQATVFHRSNSLLVGQAILSPAKTPGPRNRSGAGRRQDRL